MNLLIAIKKVWNALTTVLVVLVVLFAVLMVGVRAVGLEPYVVTSGSMAREFPVGSVIYVKDVEPSEVEEGDIITYYLTGTTLSTHRVIGVDVENRCFYTKGDENAIEDGKPVSYDDLVGMPIFSIPYIGFVVDFVQHPPGTYVAISAGAILLILTFLLDYLTKEDKEEDPVPEAAEEAEPEAEGVPAPDAEEEATDEAEGADAAEAEGVPDPEAEDAPAPEAEEVPASDTEEEPAPEAEGVPAPEAEEEEPAEAEEVPASESEEEKAPEAEGVPAPEEEGATVPDAKGDIPAPDEGDIKAE